MIRYSVSLKSIKGLFRSLYGIVSRATHDELGQAVTNVRNRMADEEGKPVSYPIQWDSEKQRKAYFASNGFGQGIPYRRRGNYQRGWKVERLTNGYTLSNKHPAAAVGGFLDGWQSRIHRGRWLTLTTAFYSEIAKLPRRILERLNITTKGSARP